MKDDICCVCGHSLSGHVKEKDGWRCHAIAKDGYQCECYLRKGRYDTLEEYGLLERIKENEDSLDKLLEYVKAHPEKEEDGHIDVKEFEVK